MTTLEHIFASDEKSVVIQVAEDGGQSYFVGVGIPGIVSVGSLGLQGWSCVYLTDFGI